MSLSFSLLFWWSIRHEYLTIALTPARARAAVISFGAGNIAYFLAIAVDLLSRACLAHGQWAGLRLLHRQTDACPRPCGN